MKQRTLFQLLIIGIFINAPIKAQLPTIDEALSLVITQKKASDSRDEFPFAPAPGTKPKLYSGHFTSKYNEECIVTCSFLQGRDIKQVALLLYKNKEGYWKNGCWYFDNYYRLKFKDINKDSVLELLLETKINSGNKSYGSYKIISLMNQNTQILYENNSVLGFDSNSLKNEAIGKEVTKDLKVTLIDTVKNVPCMLKERIIKGTLKSYNDSTGAKLKYETIYQNYLFLDSKFVPKIE